MELYIAVVSLLWVIGVLTLQRFDSTDSDFAKATALYTSTVDGVMNMEQLAINSAKPRGAVIRYLKFLITKSKRTDKGGLKKSLEYFNQSNSLRFFYLTTLILITVLVPVLHQIDFTGFPLTVNFTKNSILLIIIIFFAILSVSIEKMLRVLADKYYPISYQLKE